MQSLLIEHYCLLPFSLSRMRNLYENSWSITETKIMPCHVSVHVMLSELKLVVTWAIHLLGSSFCSLTKSLLGSCLAAISLH